MKIKKASEEDVIGIARIYVDCWKTTYHGLVPQSYLDGLSYEDAEKNGFNFLNTENEPFIFIAISEKGNIVGFASGNSIDDENFGGELQAFIY
ncbi:hypothetical protein [Thalassobacillus sp. C254]|uniref:hypothetical protein n=1 Tax=Thalassobacillus sp. C254 TaxID=1225341 RepID=UPI0022B6C82F|nr:hypothetical protein [Thalassobacillus sp. C254]